MRSGRTVKKLPERKEKRDLQAQVRRHGLPKK